MATYAKILKDSSGNQILPYTRAELVYNGSTKISEYLIASSKNISHSGSNPVDCIASPCLVPSSSPSCEGMFLGAHGKWQALTPAIINRALGYAPANIDTSVFLYHGNCAVASWTYTTVNGYSFYQDMTFSADNGGKTNLTKAKIMNPMSVKTGTMSTEATIQKNLNIIADGYLECTKSGTIRIWTKKKPSSDITIYFEAQY